jgi:hypothetical protein
MRSSQDCSPRGVLLERILWVARDKRPFVECESYVGPDRRLKNLVPPPAAQHRPVARVARVTQPNMSQDEIGGLLQPMKAAIL